MKKTIIIAAAISSLSILAGAASANAAPSSSPQGYCKGSSSTYPWAAGPIWQGKTFQSNTVVNRVLGAEIIPGKVSKTGQNTWKIEYQPTTGLPVTDTIKAVGNNAYDGDIYVAGTHAGKFGLQC